MFNFVFNKCLKIWPCNSSEKSNKVQKLHATCNTRRTAQNPIAIGHKSDSCGLKIRQKVHGVLQSI